MRAALGFALVFVAGACGGGGEEPRQVTERPTSTATIKIAAPRAGDVVEGPDVTLEIILEGGKVVDEVSRNLTPNEGHVHVKLDDTVITQTYGQEGLRDTIEVEPGRHLLQAEFVAKDHGRFDPRVLDSVTFTVE